jgi:hypothetical protein
LQSCKQLNLIDLFNNPIRGLETARKRLELTPLDVHVLASRLFAYRDELERREEGGWKPVRTKAVYSEKANDWTVTVNGKPFRLGKKSQDPYDGTALLSLEVALTAKPTPSVQIAGSENPTRTGQPKVIRAYWDDAAGDFLPGIESASQTFVRWKQDFVSAVATKMGISEGQAKQEIQKVPQWQQEWMRDRQEPAERLVQVLRAAPEDRDTVTPYDLGLSQPARMARARLAREWQALLRRGTIKRCQCTSCRVPGGRWFVVQRKATRAIDCAYCRRALSKATRWRHRAEATRRRKQAQLEWAQLIGD